MVNGVYPGFSDHLGFSLAYGHRVLSEEKFLCQELGDRYVEYMRRTKRVIRFLV